jgi:hypothetical protein
MFTFNSPKVVEKWHVFSDAYFGGRSKAALQYNAEEQVCVWDISKVLLTKGP